MNRVFCIFIAFLIGFSSNVLKAEEATVSRDDVLRVAFRLHDYTWFQNAVQEIERSGNDATSRSRSFQALRDDAVRILRLQQDLDWLDIEAVRLAFADKKSSPAYDPTPYLPLMDELERLVRNGFDGIYQLDEQAIRDAERALSNRRTILLSNPLLDIDRIIAINYRLGGNARSVMAPALGTQNNNWSNQSSARRTGFNAQLVELTNLRGDVQVRTIHQAERTAPITNLKLHWDGNRVMFTSTMPDNRWNVFEIKMDGTGFRPLIYTIQPDLEFYDGVYLPDGRIIAASNIGYHGVPCVNGNDVVGNFILFNPADNSIRRLTFDQDASWDPVIMHNGRVMYVRWEYTDLMHYYSRIVFHMNPDGTEQRALYGSGRVFPNAVFDVQPIPGHPTAFIGMVSGHHGVARAGRLMIFDPSQGRACVQGIVQEIPFRNRPVIPVVKDFLVDTNWPKFNKPMPLDDKYFLVTAKLTPDALWGIYLVDVFDNVTPIKRVEGEGFINPILVRETPVPPIIPDRVDLTTQEAVVFIQDIHEGQGLPDVPRGVVRELRVFAYEYAYIRSPSDHVAMGVQSGWDIKRVLGTVPVEEDGSAMFIVPANVPISLQPLDEDGAAIQWMRSWFTAMPGEIVSCVGCHDHHNTIPVLRRAMAAERPPTPLAIPEGGVRPFTFNLEIQPILDRSCIACHTGVGGAFDLRAGRSSGPRDFGTSYLNLHPFVRRQGPEAGMQVLFPMEYHANTSELIRMLRRGHHNVELTDYEMRKLITWIDLNAPYHGIFRDVSYWAGFPFLGVCQIERRIYLANRYAVGSGVDWRQELADYAAFLEAQGSVTPATPRRAVPPTPVNVSARGWPFTPDQIPAMRNGVTETRKEIEIAPGVNMAFVHIPAGEFVMGSNFGSPTAFPPSRQTISRPFWMSEVEVTNEQFRVIFPDHDSRYVDQFWKDHVYEGYPANLNFQPVIRVNFNEAMEFARRLSELTGLNMTLPTEAQWEWACRAGTDTDFWFGCLNTDFSPYENLADYQLTFKAVSGVDPRPMGRGNQWFPYFNFIPKVETVDDGSMIQVCSRTYKPNPFGLYSMHGNIAEWTRSYYLPYPFNENSRQTSRYKVVRGGSWLDRPQFATSHYRKAYFPWQRIHNVGFRLIIE